MTKAKDGTTHTAARDAMRAEQARPTTQEVRVLVNRIALSALLSLMLPALVAATGLRSMSPTIKPSVQAPPLPGEESLVPLLGLDRLSSDSAVVAASTCSLAQCDPQSCPLGPNRACLMQTFEDIQWRLCVYASQFGTTSNQSNKGLEIGQVYLRRLFVPNDPWRLILYRAGLADIITVYHSGVNTPFYESRYLNGWNLGRQTVTQADAGPTGTLITLTQDASLGPAVVAECRDRGLAWLCKQESSASRRSQELAVWGILDTGNYDFIIEYGFRNDGTISMRVGATGYNDVKRPDEPHMHDGLWRIDMDLNGESGDSAYLVRHREPTSSDGKQAVDAHDLFAEGAEGAERWNPLEFTSLLVEDKALNSSGKHLGYKLEPLRVGNARHYFFEKNDQLQEDWSQYDFWITQWHSHEDTAWAVHPWKNPEEYLSSYINPGESILNQDLVLWYLASAHHDPTDEDRDGQGNVGVTLMHWYGLELQPHNFFDRNPLGAPEACGH